MIPFEAETLRSRRAHLHRDLCACAEALPADEFLLLLESNQIEGEDLYMHALAGPLVAWLGLRDHAVAGHRLTERLLHQAHHDLMHDRTTCTRSGCYRTGGVGIYSADKLIYACAPAWRVPQLMRCWLRNFDTPGMDRRWLHQRFLDIHPYADGNGRMARLLWAYDLLRRKLKVYPILRDYGHYLGLCDPKPGGTGRDFYGAQQRYYARLRAHSQHWPRASMRYPNKLKRASPHKSPRR